MEFQILNFNSQIRENEATLMTRESDRQDCPGLNIKWNSLKGTEESDVSKQSLLRVTASIFDPSGFLSPFVIRLKILFQILCKDKINWGETLAGNYLADWFSMMVELQLLSACRVRRCYYDIGSEVAKIELHGFCDASEMAYSAV